MINFQITKEKGANLIKKIQNFSFHCYFSAKVSKRLKRKRLWNLSALTKQIIRTMTFVSALLIHKIMEEMEWCEKK